VNNGDIEAAKFNRWSSHLAMEPSARACGGEPGRRVIVSGAIGGSRFYRLAAHIERAGTPACRFLQIAQTPADIAKVAARQFALSA
jgi:hypothetical protein